MRLLILFVLALAGISQAQVAMKPTTTIRTERAKAIGSKSYHCSRDYFEAGKAAPERGLIDNCVYVRAWMDGDTLRWKPVLASTNASEFSVERYRVYLTTDGVNLTPLIDIAPFSYELKMHKFRYADTSYTVYVEAVGKPNITSRLSRAVKYKP